MKLIDAFSALQTIIIVVNGVCSDWGPVISGVRQDTVPSPLFFSLRINDNSTEIESGIITVFAIVKSRTKRIL